MTMRKRFLPLLLCLLLCLSLFPASAFAAEPVTEEAAVQEELSETPPETEETLDTGSAPEDGEESAPAEETSEEVLPEESEEALPAEEAEEVLPAEEAEESGEIEVEPEEAEEASEDEEIEYVVEQPIVSYVPGGESDDGSLLDGYAKEQLDALRPQGMSIMAVHDSGLALEGVNRTVFRNLKAQIASVAAGERTSTIMEIPVADLGLSKTSWTAAELGVESLVVIGPDGQKTLSDEAMEKVNEQVGFSLRPVITALLADCPYELYWYEKTMGTDLKSYSFSGSEAMIRITGSMFFYFNVAGVYCDGVTTQLENGKLVRVGINPDTGAAVRDAVANAQSISASYEGRSDYDKLLGFKNAICSMVSYNYDALAEGVDYGDPWQIIYVFDGRDNTNVVCEGYAKAFQYLCDIGNLSGRMMTYTVSGVMGGGTGAGSHMWNIVRMENGKNYIVDVTNCDEGSIGAPDALFLAGVDAGSVDEGYAVMIGDTSVTYEYAETIRAIFSDAELTISENSYLEDIEQHETDVVWNEAQLKAAIAAFEQSGTGGTLTYPGDGDFYVGEDVTIPATVSFSLPDGTLYVKNGVTMTIAAKASVSAKHAQIEGSLIIEANGRLELPKTSSQLIVNGQMENSGSVYTLNDGFVRTEHMLAAGQGKYYVDHNITSDAKLAEAFAYAAEAAGDEAVMHELLIRKAVSLNAKATLPANARMMIYAGTGFSIPAGVTLTNEGYIQVQKSLVLEGKLVNNGDIRLAKDITASFGNYAGTGTLGVYKDGTNAFSKLSGVTEDMFEVVLGYPSAFLGLKLLDPEGTDPRIVTAKAASLNLDGTVGLNFKVVFSDSVLESENAEAVFLYKEQETRKPIAGMSPDSNGYYVFTFRIPAPEFANAVQLKFVDGDTVIPFYNSAGRLENDTLSYSGQRYSEVLPAGNRARALIDALHSYCHYAYYGLEYGEPNVAPDPKATTPDISSVTAASVEPYKNVVTGSVTGLSANAISLMLESATEINIKFKLQSGHSISEYSFKLDGKTVTPVYKGGLYIVTVRDIAAKDLDTRHTLVVTAGEEQLTISTCALSYCYSVLANNLLTTEMQNTCKALYLYNQAANAYFGG